MYRVQLSIKLLVRVRIDMILVVQQSRARRTSTCLHMNKSYRLLNVLIRTLCYTTVLCSLLLLPVSTWWYVKKKLDVPSAC